MSVALAINPITWTNDDMPELGGDGGFFIGVVDQGFGLFFGSDAGVSDQFARLDTLLILQPLRFPFGVGSCLFGSTRIFQPFRDPLAARVHRPEQRSPCQERNRSKHDQEVNYLAE